MRIAMEWICPRRSHSASLCFKIIIDTIRELNCLSMALPVHRFRDCNLPTYFRKFKTIVLCESKKIGIVSKGILDAHLQKDSSKVIRGRNGKLWNKQVNPPVGGGEGTHNYQQTRLMIPFLSLSPRYYIGLWSFPRYWQPLLCRSTHGTKTTGVILEGMCSSSANVRLQHWK